ncbi:hypothetical protein BGZ76_011395, partial [Entomortierella beljakovae]
MTTPIQIDEELLDRLNQLGPKAGEDIQVFEGSIKKSSIDNNSPQSTTANGRTKLSFQPQRKYVLEGRIIHKRKLSRKLFFLDICLTRRKNGAVNQDSTSQLPKEGYESSKWDDILKSQGVSYDSQLQTSHTTYLKMEVISRYPVHSLDRIDDLWRMVQLGSVVRVYGDIEISQSSAGSELETGSTLDDDKRSNPQWSLLLHCVDLEVLEPWEGKEGFEPNTELLTSSRSVKTDLSHTTQQNKKRKSEEINNKSLVAGNKCPAPTAGKQQQQDPQQQHCKFWINSGRCNKEQCLFWHESDPAKLKAERRRWVEERIQAKRQISHHVSDPHRMTTKNQHRERALYFAHWLINTFTRDYLNSEHGVLDIAGGRGDLSWELQTRQGIKSTIVEPRPGKGMRKWQRRWLETFKEKNSQGPPFHSEELKAVVPTATNISIENSEDADADDDEPVNEADLTDLKGFIPQVLTYPLQSTEPARIQDMLDDKFLSKHHELIDGASILVGLHPDQATEPIVRTALKLGKPFAVIPCCVFGRDNPHRRLQIIPENGLDVNNVKDDDNDNDNDKGQPTRAVTSYDDFVIWLTTLHPNIETTWLNFE